MLLQMGMKKLNFLPFLSIKAWVAVYLDKENVSVQWLLQSTTQTTLRFYGDAQELITSTKKGTQL